MAATRDRTKDTPGAVLRSFIDRLEPRQRKLVRSVRTAVRERLPTANELACDDSSRFVVA